MDRSGTTLACPQKFTLLKGVSNMSLMFVISLSREANLISVALYIVSNTFYHQVFTNTHLCSVRFFLSSSSNFYFSSFSVALVCCFARQMLQQIFQVSCPYAISNTIPELLLSILKWLTDWITNTDDLGSWSWVIDRSGVLQLSYDRLAHWVYRDHFYRRWSFGHHQWISGWPLYQSHCIVVTHYA